MAIGPIAGTSNTTGSEWMAIGVNAGRQNITGSNWTAVGFEAGRNGTAYSRSIFLGYRAGRDETASDRLYIEPTESARPLIFGRFDTDDLTIFATDAGTNDVDHILTLDRSSTGTAASGFGARLRWQLESSFTDSRDAAAIDALWATATDASRSADLVLSAYYTTTAREGLRVRGGSAGPQVGLYGATPVSQAAAIASPAGGIVVDTEARAAIDLIRAALSGIGITA
jgi:hypothetical protein